MRDEPRYGTLGTPLADLREVLTFAVKGIGWGHSSQSRRRGSDDIEVRMTVDDLVERLGRCGYTVTNRRGGS